MTKSEIRQFIKTLKASIPNTQKEIDAFLVTSAIEKSQWFKNAHHILTYHSLPDEISTIAHFNWANDKHLYLPRVAGDSLEILPYGNTAIGSFRIHEPIGEDIINVQEIELAIIPGVAFDRNGARMGRGKGYYDRLLSTTNALKIGICYDCQLLDSIPQETHDIKMDAIVTPTQQIILTHNTPW